MKKHPMRFAFMAFTALLLTSTGVVVANMVAAATTAPDAASSASPVTVSGGLTQTKLFLPDGDTFGLALTLECAPDLPQATATRGVDLVVVLDRSGSMAGQKMRDAKAAVAELLQSLGSEDRFALVSYANDVTVHNRLTPVSDLHRTTLVGNAMSIESGGGTNLGGGLAAGLELLAQNLRRQANGGLYGSNLAKIILISDGHANQGMIDPVALGTLAARGYRSDASVTTVGVGVDYNEHLMGTIADYGGGNYYFLEHPAMFASLFLEELSLTRAVAARNLEVLIPLPDGVTLTDAAGYPVEQRGKVAVLRPGNLRSGQKRTIFLTLKAGGPAGRSYVLDHLTATYTRDDAAMTATMNTPLALDVVDTADEAYASIDPALWTRQTVQEDYNRLREDVSRDVASGDRNAALEKITAYETGKRALNAKVGSKVVDQNLDQDVALLKETVEASLAPSASPLARKQASKAMQAESYDQRRAKVKQ